MIEPFAIDLETGDLFLRDPDANMAMSYLTVAIQRELDLFLLGSVAHIELYHVSQSLRVAIDTPEGARVQVVTDPITGWNAKDVAWLVMGTLYRQRGQTIPDRYVYMPDDAYADPLRRVV